MTESSSQKTVAVWVLFGLVAIGVLSAIFVAWLSGRERREEVNRRTAVVSELRMLDVELQSLTKMAKDKYQLRMDEGNLIRSMLQPIKSASEMDFDLGHFVWKHSESWLQDEEGGFSVIFYTPQGTTKHRLVATATPADKLDRQVAQTITTSFPQFGMIPLVVPTGKLKISDDPCRLECELQPDHAYEFRIVQVEKGGRVLRLRLELLDQAGKSLAQKEVSISERYASRYSRRSPNNNFARPNELAAYELPFRTEGINRESRSRGVELLRLILPFDSNTQQSLDIKCVAVSEGPEVVDPIDLVRSGWSTSKLLDILTPMDNGTLSVREVSKPSDSDNQK